jgi:hypothetical protein
MEVIGSRSDAGAGPELSRREAAELTRSAVVAGLVVALVYIICFFVFFLFATLIWFN